MSIDLLSVSCEEEEEFLYWVTKMCQYFEDKFFQISVNFWLSFTSYFSENKLIGLGNASLLLAIFSKCPSGNYCNDYYTCLSILLATFNYRVRGTCVPARAFHARIAR